MIKFNLETLSVAFGLPNVAITMMPSWYKYNRRWGFVNSLNLWKLIVFLKWCHTICSLNYEPIWCNFWPSLPNDDAKFSYLTKTITMLKLDYCDGVWGKTAAWIKAFLSDRSQVVSFNGSHSSPRAVPSGVPQGSVLALVLFLFLLYINDITEHIQSTKRPLADVSIVCREINNIAPAGLNQFMWMGWNLATKF